MVLHSRKFTDRFRFSIRTLLLGLVVCSVLFALLAFHLGKLRRQAAAADYFRNNNSSPIAGSVEFNQFTFDGNVTTEDNAKPKLKPKSGSIVVLLPVVKLQNDDSLVSTLVGEWFVRRVRVVQIGVDAELDVATLITNISKMPWLEEIVVECKFSSSAPDGLRNIVDCALSDAQIEQLRDSFPDLKITKTGWINP